MNEIEQAIDELKQQLHNSEDCVVNGVTCELAIESLEKQIPKKVEHNMCPCCFGANFYDDWDNKNEYCGDCGQKLDWSVEE